ILALVTLGEGWHNNHHYYSSTANQGFFWWEIDLSFYTLKVLSWMGLVSDLRLPTDRARFKNWVDIEARDRLLARYGLSAPEEHTHDAPLAGEDGVIPTHALAATAVPLEPAE